MLLLSSACALETTPPGEPQLVPSELDLPTGDGDFATLADLLATPAMPVSGEDESEHSVVDKVRAGVVIDYDDLLGNSLVFLINTNGRACTAQVVNEFFLLTAAHCVHEASPVNWQTPWNAIVQFTRRNGTRFNVYNGTAYSGVVPNWTLWWRDVALVFLQNGMTTCHGTNSWCAANRPDIPVHAQFQYYDSPRDTTLPVHTPYWLAGYGTTDNFNGAGVLRAGPTTFSDFFALPASDPAGGGLRIMTRWTSDSSPRACQGDSGSPLIPVGSPFLPKPSPNRNFYTGVASTSGCLTTPGSTVYTGLDTARALWVVQHLALFGQLLGFTCFAVPNLPAETFAFECTNN